MRRLNWGCGPIIAVGWESSDVVGYNRTQDHVGDIAAGLPWDDGTFDYVVAHHALQMLDWQQLVPALVELRRVTRPGGWLRVSVPDVLGAVDAWEKGDAAWFPIADEHERSIDGKLCMYVTQAGATRSVFTQTWLIELLLRAGWQRGRPTIARQSWSGIAGIVTLDSRESESLYVEAHR